MCVYGPLIEFEYFVVESLTVNYNNVRLLFYERERDMVAGICVT